MSSSRFAHVLSIVIAAALLATGATSASAATGTGAEYGPDVQLRELHASIVRPGEQVSTLHWKPNRLRLIEASVSLPRFRFVTERVGGARLAGEGIVADLHDVTVFRNSGTVQPDGYDELDFTVMGYAWPLIARVRGGDTGALATVTVGGRQLLRGTVTLAANDCAALRAGTRTVHLDPRTLMPVTVSDRRGGVRTTIAIRSIAARASDFVPVQVVGRRTYRNEGQIRMTAAVGLVPLTFELSRPAALPAGFALDHRGSARLGSPVGPEASFPRSNGLYFERHARGLEHIGITIRGNRGSLANMWDISDPFAGECSGDRQSDVTVTTSTGPVTGHYSLGEFGYPRLWWRVGATLYSITGAYSAEQLAAMASSFAPLAK